VVIDSVLAIIRFRGAIQPTSSLYLLAYRTYKPFYYVKNLPQSCIFQDLTANLVTDAIKNTDYYLQPRCREIYILSYSHLRLNYVNM